MSERRTYAGQCHCGAVKFEMTSDLAGLGDCNCSMCSRLGWVMQTVPESDFRLLEGADKLSTYRFGSRMYAHQFCTTCGIESFARGDDGSDVVAEPVVLATSQPTDLHADVELPGPEPHQFLGLARLARGRHHADRREVEGGCDGHPGAGQLGRDDIHPRSRDHRRLESVLETLASMRQHPVTGGARLDEGVLDVGGEFRG